MSGELYRLRQPARTFEALDRYEEHYRRELRVATLESGPAHRAWVYLCLRPLPEDHHIASGEWTA